MKNSPEVSVVITFFREKELLKESIDSVLKQTFQDFEIVLVDNNASPETRSVAETYVKKEPDRIRIVHEPVQGMCSAKNAGILQSRGIYIALLDGDDLMKPNRLQHQRDILASRPDLSLVTCAYDRISHDGLKVLEERVYSPTLQSVMWQSLEQEFAKLYGHSFPASHVKTFSLTIPSTFFLRKETAINAGLFDIRLNPRWCEDYELQTRLFLQGPFYRIPDPLIGYRAASLDAQRLKEQQISGFERYWQDQRFFTILWENFSGFGPETQAALKKIRSLWLKSVGLHFIGYQEGVRIVRTLFKRSLLSHPGDKEIWKLFLKSLAPTQLRSRLFWMKTVEKAEWIRNEPEFGKQFLSWPPQFPPKGPPINKEVRKERPPAC